jgi:hypothetical protein
VSLQRFWAPAAILLTLAGCVQNDTETYNAPEQDDPEYLGANNTARADEPGVNSDWRLAAKEFRRVYIAQADLSKIQVVAPNAGDANDGWKVNDAERGVLQSALVDEFSDTLGYAAGYEIVDSREQAQMIVHTTIMAIRLGTARDSTVAGAGSSGAITASITIVNASTGDVMVRSVDTRSSNNILAFQRVEDHDPAINLIFRAWGNSLRQGMLHLQGRTDDTAAQPVKPAGESSPR